MTATEPRHRATQELIRKYVLKNFTGTVNGQRPRVLHARLSRAGCGRNGPRVVGHIVNERTSGETIRDTYGDYITDESARSTYFEPGVLAPSAPNPSSSDLKLWAEFSDSDGGILETGDRVSRQARSREDARPDQAGQFPLPESAPRRRDRTFLPHRSLHHRLQGPPHERGAGGGILRPGAGGAGRQTRAEKGRGAWEQIVEFMSGGRPSATAETNATSPAPRRCIALVYQGVDAVRKIREVLGPTDPSKAPPGSIRREFGQTIMVNAAHASDSAENAQREMGIVQIDENNLKPLIETFYARQ